MRLIVLLIGIIALTPLCQARMYKWNDPATGTTQMSGKPPAWYRSTGKGPRVYVFDEGRLVDDTGMAVSETRRLELRREAMRLAMPATERARDDAALRQAIADGGAEEPVSAGTPVPEFEEDLAALLADDDTNKKAGETATRENPEATIARLKAVLDAWDQRQTEKARALLE